MPTVLYALVVGVALHPEHGTVLQATHACGEAKQPDGTGADMEECARNYTAAFVLALAAHPMSHAHVLAQEAAHERARATCASGETLYQDNGAWCVEGGSPVRQHRTSVLTPLSSDVPYEQSIDHVPAAQAILNTLRVVLDKGDGSFYSLNDLGAGIGQLGHTLLGAMPQLDYRGFDGAGNVREFTHGFVEYRDLTMPGAIPPADWAVSSEVGEHIPHADEAQFVANLHAANCRGIVLTWAVPSQWGRSHINVHSQEYIRSLFLELGYTINEEATAVLRAVDEPCMAAHEATHGMECSWWLQGDSTVFERATPSLAPGCV